MGDHYIGKGQRILGVDIGGSHIAAALVDMDTHEIVKGSFCKNTVNSQASAEVIISQWMQAIRQVLSIIGQEHVGAMGVAIPGPFDYENGISLIQGVHKYEALYQKNIRHIISEELGNKLSIYFENDAACFGLGQTQPSHWVDNTKLLAITLGTGIGSAFVEGGELITTREDVPADGYLYNYSFRDGIAEDYISGRWLLKTYELLTGSSIEDVKALAEKAKSGDHIAKNIFIELGNNLGTLLQAVLSNFDAHELVIGGGIVRAESLFVPTLQSVLSRNRITTKIKTTISTEESAIIGACLVAKNKHYRFDF